MAHGHPDYGAAAPTSTVHLLRDMAELAARLGSIVTFDRRGDVVYMENFESGIGKWIPSSTGDGGSVTPSSATALRGAYSAKLVTGDLVGDTASISCIKPSPSLSNVGFEFAFSLDDSTQRVSLAFLVYKGGELSYSEISYEPVGKRLRYYDEDGAWQTLVENLDLYNHTKMFHTMKLVLSATQNQHSRLVVDDVEYDMSGIGIRHVTSEVSPQLVATILVEARVINSATLYVDDAIITQNEP